MPSGVYKRKPFTKEHRKNIAKCQLGRKHSDEVRKKISKTKKGIKLSEEHKKKLSKAHKGKKHSEEHKRKVSEALKNRKLSEEQKERLRKLRTGIKLSKETKKKMSEIARKRVEDGLNNFWRGGISYAPYTVDWTKTLKRSIRERDKYTCQICDKKQEDRTFSVHHIDYNKENCNPNNLITLCINCHSKTNHNRKYWIKYFNKK